MKLTNEVHIAQDPAKVFSTLLDVERVAGCMPGSRLTGRVDDSTYSGEVKVKVGPLGVSYTGTVKFLSVDEAARTAVLKASGREQHGQGNADAHVTARVVPDGAGSKVSIETDLMIRGKVAQFGRGVIGEVSQRLIDQFAKNVENSFATNGSPAPVAAAEPEAMDGAALVLQPLLKRVAPVAAGVAVGLLAGLFLKRQPRVIEVIIRHE
ncbi:carbon monoxide dehydrogenase [Kibdelosporangium aridum]|uniref:Carbon monoxide dehydrogenase n=1 Tax=Kibdelosporangium aridum TaxID=2030 RepID=A0A428YJ23_KIBAR|nr:SRPBCC family protein [Kibdelosporangium aridum]RSM67570.1 carbon monoxide dehydrogenase [Kibdelosporangium aridum]